MTYASTSYPAAAATFSSNADNTASASEKRKPASAQQLVRENVQYLIQQLEAGHSETLTAFLDAMAQFRSYSLSNQLAIARQRPGARNVAGMWTWNQLGRRVRRGEKGIAILAPMIGKSRKAKDRDNDSSTNDRAVLLGFRKTYVWAEEQTEGEPLPQLEQTTGSGGTYLDRLREYVSAQGITLEFDGSIAPALGAAFGTTIRLLPGQTDAETFTTLVHEMAHLALKHTDRRTATTKTVRETEAEAVAFVVSRAIGLNPDSSASYIQLFHGNTALLLESLQAVQQTSAAILAAITAEESVSQETPIELSQEVEAPASEPVPESVPEQKRARRSRTQTADTEAL